MATDARYQQLSSNPDIFKIFNGYVQQAEIAFRRRVLDERLVLTGELLNSFRTTAAQEAQGYIEARIEAAGYLRMKDLRSMNYARLPPQSAIEEFVEQVGVDKFPYIPGYPPGVKPVSHSVAVERIAWGIRMMRKRVPNVKRGYRGIYSDPLLKDVLPNLYSDLKTAAGLTSLRAFKTFFSS